MQLSACFSCKSNHCNRFAGDIEYAARMKNDTEVYFTSPILGQIFGKITVERGDIYRFTGTSMLVNIELKKLESGWICEQEQWLHESQVQEIGSQIDKAEKWSSAR